MQTSDGASPSIILAGRGLFVKMLITLEQCGDRAFGSNFAYLCILTLSSHWYAKIVTTGHWNINIIMY